MNVRHSLLTLLLGAALAGCGDDVTKVINQGGGTPTTDPTVFAFRSDAITEYTRVDRMGGPATTTALLSPGPSGGARRQVANSTDPVDDTDYASEYVTALKRYHFHLAPQLAGAVDTCGTAGSTEANTDVGPCVVQALANPVIPDVLRLNTSQVSDYPNGRKPDDPVVDVLLAIALLDLGGDNDGPGTCFNLPCTQKSLASLPLNVMQSTPPSLPDFPYLNNAQLAPPPPADP